MTPFGSQLQAVEPSATQSPASAFGNVYRFAGRRFDGATGLYYNRFRYYDPRSGRFLGRDPLGYTDGMSLYAYVQNQAPNLTDPLGLKQPPPVLKRFLTYVDDIEGGAFGRTEVYYKTTVVCECLGGRWKMYAGYQLYYRIKIEKQFKGTPKGTGIYGHELRHVEAVERTVSTDKTLREVILKARIRVYKDEEDCEKHRAGKRAKIEDNLVKAIAKGTGHATGPGSLKPGDKKPYKPPNGWVQPPTNEADFEKERGKREARGYKQYDPKKEAAKK